MGKLLSKLEFDPKSVKLALIVDIDGTVADCSHRRHLVETLDGSDKNWKLFCSPELTAKDKVIEEVATILNAVIDGLGVANIDVFYVSGRDAECWETTRDWLIANDLWFDSDTRLWCRGIGDKRHDVDFKRECLQKIRLTHRVLAAFDDRNSVVAMWREEGIRCFQVAPGDF